MEKTSVGHPISKEAPLFKFKVTDKSLIKETSAGIYNGKLAVNLGFPINNNLNQNDLSRIWAVESLKSKRNLQIDNPKFQVKIADFYCGAGGLSLGVSNALKSLGLEAKHEIGCDILADSLKVYNANFKPNKSILENADNLFRVIKYKEVEGTKIPVISSVILSEEISEFTSNIDFFLAGPPCQGNSNFNNITRRNDYKNNHYVSAAILGASLKSKIIIIENVEGVLKSKQNVVSVAKLILENAGYNVTNSEYLLEADKFHVAQSRKRHFLIAIKSEIFSGVREYDLPANPALSSMDVISDLVGINSSSIINTASELSQDNRKRVDYLFQHKIYNLPDKERPACHRDKKHTYNDIYGRMYPDKPAMTLTTGFQSPGRGRYVHPTQRRGLTPREGARLQSFPDYFRWITPLCNVSKQSVTRLIGDAVPPNLAEIAALIAIASCQSLQ